MKNLAIQRAAVIAFEAPPRDVTGFRELAERLTKDPLRQPYGEPCEAMASGLRSLPAVMSAAWTEGGSRYAVISKPNLSNYYPTDSIRTSEQGRVVVRICFNSSGKVTESIVTESSGSSALDYAATRFGADIRFKPALVDFQTRGDCVNQLVQFSLGSRD